MASILLPTLERHRHFGAIVKATLRIVGPLSWVLATMVTRSSTRQASHQPPPDEEIEARVQDWIAEVLTHLEADTINEELVPSERKVWDQ